jgi:hypothetical protein
MHERKREDPAASALVVVLSRPTIAAPLAPLVPVPSLACEWSTSRPALVSSAAPACHL